MVRGWTFQIGESTAPQWHYAFSRFADGISDWTPAFKEIVEDFRKGEIEQFRTEGAYGSGGWQALSPKYAAWKEQHKPGMPILVFSGLLRTAAANPKVEMGKETLKLTIDDSGSYQVFSKRKGRVVTKTKPAVAGYHQKGGGRLPTRKIIQLPQSQIIRWRKIMQSYMVSRQRVPFGGIGG